MNNEDLAKVANKPSKTLLGLFLALIAFVIIWYLSTPLVTFSYYIIKGTPLMEYSVFDLVKAIVFLLIIVALAIALLVLLRKEKLDRLLEVFTIITGISAIVSSIVILIQTDLVSNLFIKWLGQDLWFNNITFSFYILSFVAFWVGAIGSIFLNIRNRIIK